MIKDLNEAMKQYMKDLDGIIKSQDELLICKKRTLELFNTIIDEVEQIVDYKTEEMENLAKRQEEAEKKTAELKERLDSICRDIYDEYEDFDIVCPYCNYEFSAEIDESSKEIACPECHNTIELDWSGNPDSDVKDDDSGCGGDCHHCDGCDN